MPELRCASCRQPVADIIGDVVRVAHAKGEWLLRGRLELVVCARCGSIAEPPPPPPLGPPLLTLSASDIAAPVVHVVPFVDQFGPPPL